MMKLYWSLLLVLMSLVACMPKDGVVAPGAELRCLADGFKFTEGPAKGSDGCIYFTDQPNNKILKWDVEHEELSVFKTESGRSNGLYFDNDGCLVACADEHNQMWRFAADGSHELMISEYNACLLNAPNDLWIDECNGVYFTDPLYKRPYWDRDTIYQPGEYVYYYDNAGGLKPIITDFIRPNGIIANQKKNLLYVADIGDDKIWQYTIDAPGHLSGKTLFAAMGSDGMTIDKKGNVYLTNKKGVYVFDPQGKQIDLIEVPEKWTANVTIGGKRNRTLYITAFQGFYSIELKYPGLY